MAKNGNNEKNEFNLLCFRFSVIRFLNSYTNTIFINSSTSQNQNKDLLFDKKGNIMNDLKQQELVDELKKRMGPVDVLPDEPDFFSSNET